MLGWPADQWMRCQNVNGARDEVIRVEGRARIVLGKKCGKLREILLPPPMPSTIRATA